MIFAITLLRRAAMAVVLLTMAAIVCAADLPSKAGNFGGVSNTRHNLTQSFLGNNAGWMGLSRNDYGEVCVYCHTPHAASPNTVLPLWNRTLRQTTYTTYDMLGTTSVEQSYSQPGAASLACLSCHDGQTAVDSIINMPGSGRYSAAQATSQNNGFLDAWPGGPGGSFYGGHGSLDNSAAAMNQYGACMSCHSPSGDQHDPGYIPNFDVAVIGTDLRDDHPVGVTFPTTTGPSTDWNTPGGSRFGGGFSSKFFDENGDGVLQKTEIRLYNYGDGAKVECGSCHDPHGVPTAGQNSQFTKTFLRKINEGSAVCLTCHAK